MESTAARSRRWALLALALVTTNQVQAALGPWSPWEEVGSTGIQLRVATDELRSTADSSNIKADFYNGNSQSVEFSFRFSPMEVSFNRTPRAIPPGGTFGVTNGFYPEIYVPKGLSYSVLIQSVTFPGGSTTGGNGGGSTNLLELQGATGWKISGRLVTIKAETISNDRNGGSSGSLRLSLWAVKRRYAGGRLSGYTVGSYQMSPLDGGYNRGPINAKVQYRAPRKGRYYMVLALSEYSSSEYVLRDYVAFTKRVRLGR